MLFDRLVESIINGDAGSSNGIAFRKDSQGNDIGVCIGVHHGKTPTLSDKLLTRIKNIKGLVGGYSEGVGRDPIQPILNALGLKEVGNWDTRIEKVGKGAKNPNYNTVYTFMAFDTKGNPNNIENFNGTTIEDAIRKYPGARGAGINMDNAIKDIKAAGFGEQLSMPFSSQLLKDLFTKLQDSVYPPPTYRLNIDSFFGQKMHALELERNESLYQCMNRGVAFAGAGHLDELEEQFPDTIELLDKDRTI